MSIINDKKISLIAKLIVSYALLLIFAFLFYVFNTDPGSDQTAKGAVLTNLLVWTATLFTPIAAYFFYDSWKDQHNAKLCSDIAQRIWKNLDLVSSSTEDPSRKFNRIWEISSEEFNNLKPYMINVMSKLKHTVIEIESDLKLLDDLLEKDISSNLDSTFKNFTYDGTKESIDIFQKLQEEYEVLFLPYQRNVKKLLIPIIKA